MATQGAKSHKTQHHDSADQQLSRGESFSAACHPWGEHLVDPCLLTKLKWMGKTWADARECNTLDGKRWVGISDTFTCSVSFCAAVYLQHRHFRTRGEINSFAIDKSAYVLETYFG